MCVIHLQSLVINLLMKITILLYIYRMLTNYHILSLLL